MAVDPSLLDSLVAPVRGIYAGTANGFLGNRCDRLARTLGDADAHGNRPVTFTAAETDIPCLYLPTRTEPAPDGRGVVVIDSPSLYLAHDTPFAQGDQVANVRVGSTVVLAGPSTIDALVTLPGLPDTYGWRADLRDEGT